MADVMVTLISNDGVSFKVSREAIKHSKLVRDFLSTDDQEITVPLPKVGSDILPKIIAFCEYHRNEPVEAEMEFGEEMSIDMPEWDREFLNIDQAILFELISACNYLDLKLMLSACCRKVAGMIAGKSPEAVRALFNLTELISAEDEQDGQEGDWNDED